MNKRFVVGVDAKMRLYDCEQSAQEDIVDSGRKTYNNTQDKMKKIRCVKILMDKKVDFDKYAEFVDAVTSDESKDFLSLSDRLVQLDKKGANIERLLTAGVGLNAEAGEFLEIVKKMIFQGKPWSEDNREHLIIELGDAIWYIANAYGT